MAAYAKEFESRGIPSVMVVTAQFETLARKASGDLPLVVLPHALDSKPLEEIVRVAEERVPEIVGKVMAADAQAPEMPA